MKNTFQSIMKPPKRGLRKYSEWLLFGRVNNPNQTSGVLLRKLALLRYRIVLLKHELVLLKNEIV